MTITRVGGGWALYGNNPATGRWFERWYESEDKAVKFCKKRSWKYDLGRPQPLNRS